MHILLADSQPKVRFAMRVLLERQPGITVVGEVADAEGLLAYVGGSCPDLVLLDWGLPGLARGDLSLLRRDCPALNVITLSGRPETRQLALCAGADAFVSKSDPPERLLEAIANCRCGESKQKTTSNAKSASGAADA
jgi:DNA-binding NarL/FixJ family response regulator